MAKLSSEGIGVVDRPVHNSRILEVVHNLLVALTISSIALSLGAAFGVLSGRGAFAGMFSAGIIALVAAMFGGTRVQCSGPVAPMAAVMAVLFSGAMADFAADPMALGGMNPAQYLNLICFICGGALLLLAALRTGFLISYVPSPVISGFMTGISLIIWIGQTQAIFGLSGKEALGGNMVQNIVLVVTTIVLVVATPRVISRYLSQKLARIVPAPLVAIVILTTLTAVLRLDVQFVSLGASMPNWDGFVQMVRAQIPDAITWDVFKRALPSGLEFALICYLDTLMVAMIVDRISGENTRKNKELMAQGLANTAVGFIGGVPGTQASIRSVMMIKEGATMRLAGMMVGVFVILEMLLLQDVLSLIPQAVFSGILIKVGWDVCDQDPLWKFVARRDDRPSPHVFWIILGTALLTVYSLTLAVCVFTVVYYIHRVVTHRCIKKKQTHYVEGVLQDVLPDETV